MARRNDNPELVGVEKPTSGPVVLSGLITLQPNHVKKRNKQWRPLQPSDLGTGEGLGAFPTDDSSSPGDLSESIVVRQVRQVREARARARASSPSSPSWAQPRQFPYSLPTVFDRTHGFSPIADSPSSTQQAQTKMSPSSLPKIKTSMAPPKEAVTMEVPSEQQLGISSEGSDISPTDTRPHVVEDYLRLFGKLPDIIRLHEQTGDFDGQVVFIGHPNRDVSAHQWLSTSFQWVNIGLWSHTRRKIDGSLASERLENTGLAFNTIEYFKFAAEDREARVKENGRSDSDHEANGSGPAPAETNTGETTSAGGQNAMANNVNETITGAKLEDPFVTPSNTSQPPSMVAYKFRGGNGNVGSMDFDYRFPRKTSSTNEEHKEVFRQWERERLEALHRASTPQPETPAHLREVEFGEEAATGLTPPADGMAFHPQRITLTPEEIELCEQMTKDVEKLGQMTKKTLEKLKSERDKQRSENKLASEKRVAVPVLPRNHTSIRNSIPSGPTVANPYGGAFVPSFVPSTLNAAAPPYQMPTKAGSSMGTDTATALNFPVATTDPALRFSDPDGIRPEHAHPIANGFNRQAPTKQNWAGPFFADSMPTAYDPTASLSSQTTHEQELRDWYRDGQNVSRQQDYAKSLVAAVLANNNARDLGAIGEGSARKKNLAKYENTHLFARVYENMYGYAEESRAGGASSYFTRAWKPANLHTRDIGPNGNNSFYGTAPDTSPQLSRASSRAHQQPSLGDNAPRCLDIALSALRNPRSPPYELSMPVSGGFPRRY